MTKSQNQDNNKPQYDKKTIATNILIVSKAEQRLLKNLNLMFRPMTILLDSNTWISCGWLTGNSIVSDLLLSLFGSSVLLIISIKKPGNATKIQKINKNDGTTTECPVYNCL